MKIGRFYAVHDVVVKTRLSCHHFVVGLFFSISVNVTTRTSSFDGHATTGPDQEISMTRALAACTWIGRYRTGMPTT